MNMRQPWIHSPLVDGVFIVGPPLLATLVAAGFIVAGAGASGVSLLAWILLVVGIDVAHVYGTVFRTYADGEMRRQFSGWLTATPLIAWVLGVLAYSASPALFWSLLAYTAVFHFVRQQYGFLMLYSRFERAVPAWCLRMDEIAIYAATAFPLLYWHTHLPRPFAWFTENDFLALPPAVWSIALPIYAVIFAAYLLKEIWLTRRTGMFNLPRNGIVMGTALSWFVGIVLAGGDLVFTLTNVVAHGVPYLALTWVYLRRRDALAGKTRSWFVARWLPLMLALLLLLAFVEEGLWDALVWREHLAVFPGFSALPAISADAALALVVPLLAVPQVTHYVLDGVIWRLRDHPEWRQVLFYEGVGR